MKIDLNFPEAVLKRLHNRADERNVTINSLIVEYTTTELYRQLNTKRGQQERRKKGLPLGRPSAITIDKLRQISTLRSDGFSYIAIGQKLGVSGSTIYRWITQYK